MRSDLRAKYPLIQSIPPGDYFSTERKDWTEAYTDLIIENKRLRAAIVELKQTMTYFANPKLYNIFFVNDMERI